MDKEGKKKNVLHYINISVCIGALATFSFIISGFLKGTGMGLPSGFFFSFLVLDRIIRIIWEGKSSKLYLWIQICISLLFVSCSVISFLGLIEAHMIVGGIICALTVLLDSIISMVRKRKYVSRIILDILFAMLVAAIPEMSLLIMLFVLICKTFARIIWLSFSHVRLDLIAKIIRKTYASEVLIGLLFLIVAFALMMSSVDPGIPSFAEGLWYCFAIVTTIGFGDITATTIVGRILSVILGMYGIIVVALITSVIVNFYGEVRNEDDNKLDPSTADSTKK
ncbi:MAG: two pore domain potassium channel family protein [Spirochaetales bacterium]|nr:two pore domain potassium channel family protein [Spirochaetales bacterium]